MASCLNSLLSLEETREIRGRERGKKKKKEKERSIEEN